MIKQKGNIFLLLAAFIAFIFVASASFYAGQKFFEMKYKITNLAVSENTQTPTENKTANWKTYTNNRLGFSVSYPGDKNFETHENKEDEVFIMMPQSDYGLVIRKIENSRGLSLRDAAMEAIVNSSTEVDGKRVTPHDYIFTPITVANKDGIEVSGPTPSYLLISHDGALWRVAGFTLEKNLFDTILSTFKFVSTPVLEPIIQRKKLSYLLPSGWKTITSPNGRLELGFDPATTQFQTTDTNPSGISLTGIWSTTPGQTRNLGSRYSFSIKSYDGGSRHNFLYRELSFKPYGTNYDDIPENNYEREYQVSGWPCLVLFRIEISQWPQTWGICPISKTEALSFSMDGEEELVEKVLQTVRLLK